MHKTIATKAGGIHVELTAEEEQAVLDEWASNEAKQQEEENKKSEREQRKRNLKNSLKLKLLLSDEEIEILFGDVK